MNLSTLRNNLIDKMEELAYFRLVPFPLETFDRSQNTLAHLGFAVSLTTSQEQGERQRVYNRVFMETRASIIFAYRLRPHSISIDYNNALDKEVEVIEKILSSVGIEIRYNQSTRNFADSLEYALIQTEYTVLHTP